MTDAIEQRYSPDLQDHLISIDQLALDPDNSRKHSARNLESIATSLAMHGQLRPVVVNEAGKVLAGNGLVMVAQAAGWTHVAAVRYVGGDEVHQRAFAVQDNRTSELSEWDLPQLAATLGFLKDMGEDFDLTDMGWDQDDLDVLLQADWEPPEIAEVTMQTGGEHPHTVSFDAKQKEILQKAVAKARESKANWTEAEAVTEVLRAYLTA